MKKLRQGVPKKPKLCVTYLSSNFCTSILEMLFVDRGEDCQNVEAGDYTGASTDRQRPYANQGTWTISKYRKQVTPAFERFFSFLV